MTLTVINWLTWIFRLAALTFLCISAYHDAKTREIADIYTGAFAVCSVMVGFLTGETYSAIAGLIIATAFLLLPDLAGFGGADGIVYAGILAMFGYKAFPVFLLASCAFALAAWAIKKTHKPASSSIQHPSAISVPDSDDPASLSAPLVKDAEGHERGSTAECVQQEYPVFERMASVDEQCAAGSDSGREYGEKDITADNEMDKKGEGTDREEESMRRGTGEEEEAGVAMLPMILASCFVAIPITYFVWLPFLENM